MKVSKPCESERHETPKCVRGCIFKPSSGQGGAVLKERLEMQPLTHLRVSWRSLSHGLLTFMEARIVDRVALFEQKCGNCVGVVHATCAKCVRVDLFRSLCRESGSLV